MKKTEKRTETKITRRPYCKPQLEQVRLIAEEAVLGGCKTQGEIAEGGPAAWQACFQDNPSELCVQLGS